MRGVLRAEEGNMLGVFKLSSAAEIGISLAASEAESLSEPEIDQYFFVLPKKQ